MLLEEIIETATSPENGLDVEITGLTEDSRRVEPGYLFAALKGVKADGVSYIPQAVEAGAAAILIDADRVDDAVREAAKGVPLVAAADARRELAYMAARFAGHQPATMVAVTGTSGKTSVAEFTRQIFAYAGLNAASLGTLGTITSTGKSYGGLTTPGPVQLHQDLARLADDGVTHASMEASSHGLDQFRLDGVDLVAAGFTNLGRDHMDYHASVEEYFQAKLRLFTELLPEGAAVVVDPDTPFADRILAVAEERGLVPFTVGANGNNLRLLSMSADGYSQVLGIETVEGIYTIVLPLAGDFQVANALIAAGLAIAAGVETGVVMQALEQLKGAPGRIEHVATKANGGLAFVDYAHKPEALENVLTALRPFTEGRLICVFGCGGDRDNGKRPLMGEISERLADITIVTDDNPRTEDPEGIRSQILDACPAAIEIGDRATAIRRAVDMMVGGDVLCVAGKGHETGQIVGSEVLPFSDHEEILKAVEAADLQEAAERSGAPALVNLDSLAEDLGLDIFDEADEQGDADVAVEVDGLSLEDALAKEFQLDDLDLDLAIEQDEVAEEQAPADEATEEVAEAADAGEPVVEAENAGEPVAEEAVTEEVTDEKPAEVSQDNAARLMAVLEDLSFLSDDKKDEQVEAVETDDALFADTKLDDDADVVAEEQLSAENPDMASAFEEIDKLLASGEIAHVSKAVDADEVVAEDVAQEAEAFEVAEEVEAEAEALEESVAVEEPVIDEEAKARSEQFAAAPIHTRIPASLPQARKVISKPLPRKAPELVNAHLAQAEPEGGDAALWTLHDFAVAIGGELMGQPGQLINGISIDSRNISEGDAFFAIKGDRMDGHDFVETALSGGAAIAVVAREKLADLPRRRAYLVVDDVLEALERLGIASRSRMNGRVIAVTGSVGKTGTKEALRLALSRSGKTHAPVASFNNHWGVPLTLARMPKDTDFGIFEIGMNHPGEITPLSRMVRPHVAIITTVEPVHLAAFDSVEQIAKAKAEIFAGLEPGGAAVLNRDNRQYDLLRYLASVAGVKDIVTFGRRAGCDAYVTKAATTADCTSLNAVVLGEEITYKIGAPGNHYVLNSLAVLLGVCKLGADLARAGLALADMRAPKGRGEQTVLSMRGGNAVLIDESYNANPASMRAAISVLGEQTPLRNGRRIAVLGDMLELGENSDKFHADLARDLAQARIDTVYCVGTHMAHLWERLPETVRGAYAESSDELRETIVRAVRVNDIIMIKGSLGTKMGPLVETLKKHFPTEANSDPA